MPDLLFDDKHRLRNGWWVLLFIAFWIVARFPFAALGRALVHAGVSRSALDTPMAFLITLAATFACLALRKEPLSSVGFRLDRRWAAEFGWGTLLGAGVMVLAALLVMAGGGIRFELNGGRSLGALASGFQLFVFVALFEETLFRGFLFQRLADGLGPWSAQAILAVFFALAHWGNPGMSGGTKVWATLDIALAAVFLGLAYFRTGSLALPVGIHLGWNWMQGCVLGFGVSGTTPQGWLKPIFLSRPDWFTGGAFGLEASVFGVVAVLAGIGLVTAWRGSRAPEIEAA